MSEGLEDDLTLRDASPYLVLEWLIVEGMIRELDDDPSIWGVEMACRALHRHGYLDTRSYLKTP